MIPLIIVAGPTAVGKTAFAIRLALHLQTEIISADSMQIYKHMDIGTAKPSPAETKIVPHHLIDLLDPDQPFSVADYQQLFRKTVLDLLSRRKIPLLVGGTGLYIRACTQGFNLDNPAEANTSLRHELATRAEAYGNQELHRQLASVDPDAAARIHPNDSRRTIRALEVYLTTGIPLSRLQKKDTSEFDPIYILLGRERSELYLRIEHRVEQMMAMGWVEEVNNLRKMGYGPELKPMQSLGYKQLNQYLRQECTLEEAVASIKQKTRNYAKRQITWFKREPIDLNINLDEAVPEFSREIFEYLEGRLNHLSNM